MNLETMLTHLGEERHDRGAVTPPIFQTSLFVQPSLDELAARFQDQFAESDAYVYSRVGNPNLTIVQKKIAAIEETESCLVFNSGMSAVTAGILSSVAAGDHVVAVDTIYGPSRAFIKDYLPRFGVDHTFVVGSDIADFEQAIRPNTKLIVVESPSSLLFQLQDLRAIASLAKSRGITTMIDNTYSSGILQKPANFGIDIVVHSATKYFAGHSDLVAGSLCCTGERARRIMANEGQFLGALLPPFPAWLLMRGLRTLRLRVDEAQRQGAWLFGYLKNRPEVEQIFHAGDPEHPRADLFKSQMTGSVAFMSFTLKDATEAAVRRFGNALQLFQIGVSWGGHESLMVVVPMQPMHWPSQKWVVRLYIGLEHPEDLAADLDRAFKAFRS